jgi:hypothetical protein
VGTYIYSPLYTYTGLLGQLLHGVLQPLMWWSSRLSLRPAKYSSSAAFNSLHYLFWDYGIVLDLRLGLAIAQNGGRSFTALTLTAGIFGGGVKRACLYLVGPPEDELRLRLWLLLGPWPDSSISQRGDSPLSARLSGGACSWAA